LFAHQPDEKVIANIADHLQNYWDPGMRKAIVAHRAAGGVGLDPRVLKAIANLEEMVSSD
jgi:formate dehydrogenase subunit delta